LCQACEFGAAMAFMVAHGDDMPAVHASAAVGDIADGADGVGEGRHDALRPRGRILQPCEIGVRAQHLVIYGFVITEEAAVTAPRFVPPPGGEAWNGKALEEVLLR